MMLKKYKKITKFVKNNYLIFIIVGIILFVGLSAALRSFSSKKNYVYAKVKIGQGFWWASTARPNIWLVNALKKKEVEKDLLGNPIVEVLDIKYYPWWASNQYDVYLTLKLRVDLDKSTGKYTFRRSVIGIGSPIDFEFPSIQIAGTIVELSNKLVEDKYIEKTIYLSKKTAFPWEYDAIEIGEKYFDSNNVIFEILDKKYSDVAIISSDFFGNVNPSITEDRKYIQVKARIKVREIDGQLIFGEDQIVGVNRTFNISTPSFSTNDYTIGLVE